MSPFKKSGNDPSSEYISPSMEPMSKGAIRLSVRRAGQSEETSHSISIWQFENRDAQFECPKERVVSVDFFIKTQSDNVIPKSLQNREFGLICTSTKSRIKEFRSRLKDEGLHLFAAFVASANESNDIFAKENVRVLVGSKGSGCHP